MWIEVFFETTNFSNFTARNEAFWKCKKFHHNALGWANIKYLPGEWVVKYTNEDRQNVELNKMYSKKFDTDYMILGDPHEKIKIIHYLGPRNGKDI